MAGPEHLAYGLHIGCPCLCHVGLKDPPGRVTMTSIIYLPDVKEPAVTETRSMVTAGFEGTGTLTATATHAGG